MSSRKVLIWVTDEPGTEGKFLRFRKKGRQDGPEAKDATADEIAEFLDQDAENENRHDFVDTHKSLLTLLRQELQSRSGPIGVMREIAARGGLHHMGHRG